MTLPLKKPNPDKRRTTFAACRLCNKPKQRPSRTPWCRRCRWTGRHQRGKTRGLINSIWTRRLQARLKHDWEPRDKTGRRRPR